MFRSLFLPNVPAARRSPHNLGVTEIKKDLKASLDKQFEEMERDMNYGVATILDPRYKKWYFQDQEKYEEAVKFLKDALKKVVDNS